MNRPPTVPAAMRAWRVGSAGSIDRNPLGVCHEPVPEPGPGELLARVLACGVCRTDLHVVEGDLPVHRRHVVPGHEIVAEVVDTDHTDHTGFAVGDRIGIPWLAPYLWNMRVLPAWRGESVPQLAVHRLGCRRRLRRIRHRPGGFRATGPSAAQHCRTGACSASTVSVAAPISRPRSPSRGVPVSTS